MFLFRYSFLFSFLVILLAGYGWEKFEKDDLGVLSGLILILLAIFALAMGTKGATSYTYVTLTSFVLTATFYYYTFRDCFLSIEKAPMQYLVILLLLLVSGEAIINTRAMVTGILDDWNYASRSLYSEPYPDLKI